MHLRIMTVDGSVGGGAPEKILSRMAPGGLDAAVFIVPIRQGEPTPSDHAKARDAAFDGIRRIREAAEAPPALIRFARSPADAYRLEKEDRHAAYIGLGNAYAVGEDLSLISQYYQAGVRFLTLCGAADNGVCDSALDPSEDRGLSEFGRKVVAECNRTGLVIDLANASEKSCRDVLSASRAPVVVSRAAARALCDRPGSLSDDLIRAVGRTGGVILVSFDPRRLSGRTRRASVADVAKHIDYVARLAGSESVGVGSGFGQGGGVSGCRNASEILSLTVALLRRSHDETSIEFIWGGNLMRAFKRAEALRTE